MFFLNCCISALLRLGRVQWSPTELVQEQENHSDNLVLNRVGHPFHAVVLTTRLAGHCSRTHHRPNVVLLPRSELRQARQQLALGLFCWLDLHDPRVAVRHWDIRVHASLFSAIFSTRNKSHPSTHTPGTPQTPGSTHLLAMRL